MDVGAHASIKLGRRATEAAAGHGGGSSSSEFFRFAIRLSHLVLTRGPRRAEE
jgi:hypothetical protein